MIDGRRVWWPLAALAMVGWTACTQGESGDKAATEDALALSDLAHQTVTLSGETFIEFFHRIGQPGECDAVLASVREHLQVSREKNDVVFEGIFAIQKRLKPDQIEQAWAVVADDMVKMQQRVQQELNQGGPAMQAFHRRCPAQAQAVMAEMAKMQQQAKATKARLNRHP